jgi:hypothetical protein
LGAALGAGLRIERLEDRLTLSASPNLTVAGDQFVNEASPLNIANIGSFTDVVEGGPGGDGIGLDAADYTTLANANGVFHPSTSVVFNTDTLQISGGFVGTGTTVSADVGSGAYQIAVFAFTDFDLDAGVIITATGSKPLALLSLSDMTVAGTIDVSATGDGDIFNSGEWIAGPGGGNGGIGNMASTPHDGTPAAGAPLSSVGRWLVNGAGTGGGYGGAGGKGDVMGTNVGPGGVAFAALSLGIQGGSGGGTAGDTLSGAYRAGGGGGGGGIELGASSTLTIAATGQVLANGGDGADGANLAGGSGAGGAGGGILVHATNVSHAGVLVANGGSGGPNAGRSGGGGGGGSILVVHSSSGTFSDTGTESALGGQPWLGGALGGEAGGDGTATVLAETLAAPIIETFTYVINWGDLSADSTGSATIDTAGVNIGDAVAGSFDGLHTYADNGVYTVTVTVTGSGGGSDTKTLQATVNNVAPALTISGASITDEAATYTLTLSSSDPGPDTITGWKIYWGDSVETITGNPASVTHTYADGGANYPVTAMATDEDGTFSSNSISVTVNNVAPTADAGGPYFTFDDATITLSGSGADVAGALDPLSFAWDLDDNGAFETTGANVTFDPAALGFAGMQLRNVHLKVSDGDGGEAISTTTVRVLGEGTLLLDGVLYVVGGATANDLVLITQPDADIRVFASFNNDNPELFATASVNQIQVYTRGGHDIVVTTPNVVTSMRIEGGAGNDLLNGGGGANLILGGVGHDSLFGGGADDVLLGGDGNDDLFGFGGNDILVGGNGSDMLFGGTGRDLLIGSLDSDLLNGGGDDDILIGGVTIHDNDLAALDAIMAVWGSSADFTTRVNTLKNPGGLLEAGVAVFDDDAGDVIIGASGRDLAYGDTSRQWDGVKDSISLQSSQDVLVALN